MNTKELDGDLMSIDALLSEFKRQGIDTSNWDGDEGAEKAIVDGVKSAMQEYTDSRTKELTEALERLVHLHLCEQEGLQSGQPTPAMWIEAVNNAANALKNK